MTLRRTLLLACLLLLLPWSAFAQNEPVTYTIKRGDTLWGISERFIKDPYYWPNLWANNPELPNPHFIYPGQQVKVYDGRLEVVPAPTAAPQPEALAAEAPPAPSETPAAEAPAEEEVTVDVVGGDTGFISPKELAGLGIVVDTEDNRMMIARGDTIFVEMNDLAAVRPGMIFTLFEPGEEITNPVNRETVGYRVTDLGTVQITDVTGSMATGVVTVALRELQRGARIRPYQAPQREVVLKKTDLDISGYLVAAGRKQIALGQFDFIYLDVGSADGLEVGNMVNISRSRKATALSLEKEHFQVPEMLLGNAVVLTTQAHSATALILKSAAPIYRGDRVSTVIP